MNTLTVGVRILAREKLDFENTVDALLALASASERAAYQEELARIPEQDEAGEEITDTSVQDVLVPRLMNKLRSGEWTASGFGFESGQPTAIDPRLWQRLSINVRLNSAYDSWATASYQSATGSFHSLGYRITRTTDISSEANTKAQTIEKIVELFEELDGTLPINVPKARFFHEASRKLKKRVPEAWLKTAWSNAKLDPARRRPGLKSP